MTLDRVFSPAVSRARTYERKKSRSARMLACELRSPLRQFFTGGLEYDEHVDLHRVEQFIADFRRFRTLLGVSPAWGEGVELKFRRLRRHRAEGLYYPEQSVLAVDLASSRSFAHEFGHLIDYRALLPLREFGLDLRPSRGRGFSAFRRMLLHRMRQGGWADPRVSSKKGRLSWRYFASRSECFARAFEQFVAEILPAPCSLVREPSLYREDCLFFDVIPESLVDYFRSALASAERGSANPCLETSLSPRRVVL
jgi:hypothetical protein